MPVLAVDRMIQTGGFHHVQHLRWSTGGEVDVTVQMIISNATFPKYTLKFPSLCLEFMDDTAGFPEGNQAFHPHFGLFYDKFVPSFRWDLHLWIAAQIFTFIFFMCFLAVSKRGDMLKKNCVKRLKGRMCYFGISTEHVPFSISQKKSHFW